MLKKIKDIEDLLKTSDEVLIDIISKEFCLEKGFISNEDDNQNKFDEKSIKTDIRMYVRDYLQRLINAQRALHTCMESSKNGAEVSPQTDLHWESWNHWTCKSSSLDISPSVYDEEEICNTSTRNSPNALPPLPTVSRLANYRSDNSKSTGSSPLSPPATTLTNKLSNSSSSSSAFFNLNSHIIVDPNHAQPISRRPTPPATPPIVHHKRSFILSSSSIFSNSRKTDLKFPTTPPPIRRHQTNVFNREQFPLTKSKSHEEHLSNRIEPLDPAIAKYYINIFLILFFSYFDFFYLDSKFMKKYNLGLFCTKPKSTNPKQHNSLDNLPNLPHQHRRRLATEPGSIGSTSPILTSSNCSSPLAISPDNQTHHGNKPPVGEIFADAEKKNNAPRSPNPPGMLHAIQHRFTTTMKINNCSVCNKPMLIGYKCRDCKYYCHWDCAERAPQSCGLPKAFYDAFKQALADVGKGKAGSPSASHKSLSSASFSYRTKSQLSNYSTTSPHSTSNPASPALFNHHSASSSAAISPNFLKLNSKFKFPPDINITYSALSSEEETAISSDSNLPCDDEAQNFSTIQEEEEILRSAVVDSDKSEQTDHIDNVEKQSTLIASGSSGDSVHTVTGRLNSQDSQASDADPREHDWPRQNSVKNKEWEIAMDEVTIEKEIGPGRFGTVFAGFWHGQVAVKQLYMGNNIEDNEIAFDSFKNEVEVFRKTRHENLVLFMGCCMKPPHLAIVTSLCKGLTLHTHIHERHDRFNLNRIVLIACQIVQGMSYLHYREIIHKDLRTKNIFYENGKVLITDFGLSSVAKLCGHVKYY